MAIIFRKMPVAIFLIGLLFVFAIGCSNNVISSGIGLASNSVDTPDSLFSSELTATPIAYSAAYPPDHRSSQVSNEPVLFYFLVDESGSVNAADCLPNPTRRRLVHFAFEIFEFTRPLDEPRDHIYVALRAYRSNSAEILPITRVTDLTDSQLALVQSYNENDLTKLTGNSTFTGTAIHDLANEIDVWQSDLTKPLSRVFVILITDGNPISGDSYSLSEELGGLSQFGDVEIHQINICGSSSTSLADGDLNDSVSVFNHTEDGDGSSLKPVVDRLAGFLPIKGIWHDDDNREFSGWEEVHVHVPVFFESNENKYQFSVNGQAGLRSHQIGPATDCGNRPLVVDFPPGNYGYTYFTIKEPRFQIVFETAPAIINYGSITGLITVTFDDKTKYWRDNVDEILDCFYINLSIDGVNIYPEYWNTADYPTVTRLFRFVPKENSSRFFPVWDMSIEIRFGGKFGESLIPQKNTSIATIFRPAIDMINVEPGVQTGTTSISLRSIYDHFPENLFVNDGPEFSIFTGQTPGSTISLAVMPTDYPIPSNGNCPTSPDYPVLKVAGNPLLALPDGRSQLLFAVTADADSNATMDYEIRLFSYLFEGCGFNKLTISWEQREIEEPSSVIFLDNKITCNLLTKMCQ